MLVLLLIFRTELVSPETTSRWFALVCRKETSPGTACSWKYISPSIRELYVIERHSIRDREHKNRVLLLFFKCDFSHRDVKIDEGATGVCGQVADKVEAFRERSVHARLVWRPADR